ncbi:tripeptidyl peptidase A [Clavulina sp. PMI_390]|nr:tripeptidyl peptidase A [Clavulina sp. PMI_390]
MMWSTFIKALAVISLARAGSASIYSSDFVLKSSTQPPAGWQATGFPSPSHLITLRIALAQPNLPLLEQHLLQIANPSHARWREHLTKEEVDDLTAPSQEALGAVDSWLAEFGLDVDVHPTERTSANDWLVVHDVPISTAERLLNTTYSIFTHSETGKQVVRTTSYRVPAAVDEYVDVVQPTDYFGVGIKPLSSGFTFEEESASATTFNITLSQLKELYGITGYTPSGKHSRVGVTGYLEQYANLNDLELFYETFLPQAANTTLTVKLINGANNSQNPADAGGEAELDVQWAGGVSWPIPNTFYSTYGRGQNTNPNISYEDNGNEPYDVFLTYLLSQPSSQLPQTLTTSYAEAESDVPLNYARKVCALYAAVGARGVSALHSSGDGGVGNGDSTTPCYTPNKFAALFPPSCPYVTAVGGTYLIPETAVSFSGGGFSDYFPRQFWQDSAVDKYLNTQLKGTYKGLFNATGRGIPDIAAQSVRFNIIYQGKVALISGTSASCPAFAGVVALLNDALVSKGKKPLGWLNPWIYSLKTGFNDITTGSNPGCATPGFNATVGWDPVTGFGTPNFPELLKQLV